MCEYKNLPLIGNDLPNGSDVLDYMNGDELTIKQAIKIDICHSQKRIEFGGFGHFLIIGATSFLGSSIAFDLNDSGRKVTVVEDLADLPMLDSMSWFRWGQLKEKKLSPKYMDMSNKDKINDVFEDHIPDTVIFIPSPAFDGVQDTKKTFELSQLSKKLQKFVNLLELVRTKYKQTRVILFTLSQQASPSVQKSWLRTFEVSLSAFQSLYELRTVLIRVDGVYGPMQGERDSYFPEQSKSCTYINVIARLVLFAAKSTEVCSDIDLGSCIGQPANPDINVTAIITSSHSGAIQITKEWAEKHKQLVEKEGKDVFMTTYFTQARNPLYSYQIRSNSFMFMKGWFLSAASLGKHIVVFHDHLDEFFQYRVKEFYPNTEFIFVSNLHGRTTNDIRFYLEYDYLLHHPEVHSVILADLRDVKFFADPFEQMEVLGDNVYVGIDVSFYLSSHDYPWLRGILRQCHHSDADSNAVKLHPFLNAGVAGGTRRAMLAFLTQMTRYLDKAPHNHNCNMGTVNVVTHKHFFDQLYTGYPFQSSFKLGIQGANPQGLSVKHKDTGELWG